MKGIVFTEFLQFVENQHGIEIVDAIIDLADLPSGGAYTSVATYDHSEIVSLVAALSTKTQIATPEIIDTFGQYLGTQFAIKFPQFFEECADFLTFMSAVDSHIHVEVHKLYPDAQLPKIVVLSSDPKKTIVRYRSPRGMHNLAEGLIKGSGTYYGHVIKTTTVMGDDELGQYTDITLRIVGSTNDLDSSG
ncbi:heme NO-binding domain-containing protein [Maritalea sp.]|jgi:hypothetical protein|uniref:heme NO-binding domain-containing protein n=1 Tax=Maritalea sp. TaxID=2003361 RepID=UPI0039E4FB49